MSSIKAAAPGVDAAINQPKYYGPAIPHLDRIKAIGQEVREKGFTGLKTNSFIYDAQDHLTGWGTEPVEEAIRAHPPNDRAGLMAYRNTA